MYFIRYTDRYTASILTALFSTFESLLIFYDLKKIVRELL